MREREEEIEWVLAENKYGPRDAMRGFHGYNVRGMAVDIIALRQRVSELGEQLAAAKADAENILAGRRAEADALHQRLTTAERERDEARATVEAQRVVLDGMHRRAERAEAVVEAARKWRSAFLFERMEDTKAARRSKEDAEDELVKAVRALDAAEGGA